MKTQCMNLNPMSFECSSGGHGRCFVNTCDCWCHKKKADRWMRYVAAREEQLRASDTVGWLTAQRTMDAIDQEIASERNAYRVRE